MLLFPPSSLCQLQLEVTFIMKSFYALVDLVLSHVCFSVLSYKCLWARQRERGRTLELLAARAALHLW